MAGHGVQQILHPLRQLHRGTKEQVDFPQHALVHLDRNGHHGFKTCVPAVWQAGRRNGSDRNHTHLRLLLGLATQARPGGQAMLIRGHRSGQTICSQHHITLIAFIRPAHHGGIGLGDTADLLREALGQGVETARVGGLGTHFVQGREALVFDSDAGGFFTHLVFQVNVGGLQGMRHQIEACRQLAKLVIGIHRQPCAQVPLAQAGLGLLQP